MFHKYVSFINTFESVLQLKWWKSRSISCLYGSGQNWRKRTFILFTHTAACGWHQFSWAQKIWSHINHLKQGSYGICSKQPESSTSSFQWSKTCFLTWKISPAHQTDTFHKSSQSAWIDWSNFRDAVLTLSFLSTLSSLRPRSLYVKSLSECSSVSRCSPAHSGLRIKKAVECTPNGVFWCHRKQPQHGVDYKT